MLSGNTTSRTSTATFREELTPMDESASGD
jgi:hypothetical protein